jgi:uncharacterized repeat protein (TIGR01451 family)
VPKKHAAITDSRRDYGNYDCGSRKCISGPVCRAYFSMQSGWNVPKCHENRNRRRVTFAALAVAACIAGFVRPALAAGTPAGTVISNSAEVTFELNGTTATIQSNTVQLVVVERIDVTVILQSGQEQVAANDSGRTLLFSVSNTGNGVETYALAINSVLTGDDFDPVPATPAIFFDSDGSGDLTAADVAYDPGVNDPQLNADETINVLLVNDIPGTVLNGELGRSELTASAVTGTGVPGAVFAGQGDGGLDAVIGSSGGEAAQFGEYIVSDVQLSVVKSVQVSDPFGGQQPLPGASLQYTINVEVTNGGTAIAAAVRDAIPAGTTYTANSITLNGAAISDAADGDAGELDTGSATPAVVVRLGDLVQADGLQTVVFEVTID